jgi:hypothetical protein
MGPELLLPTSQLESWRPENSGDAEMKLALDENALKG